MQTLPFTTWNIDEVIADVVRQSESRFGLHNIARASDWIKDDYRYYLNLALVKTVEELVDDAQQVRNECANSYMNNVSCPNDFGNTRTADCFFWYTVILFYDRLISVGLTTNDNGRTGQLQVVNSGLTGRERILIHCYKQKPAIRRGEKGYQDYMTFARPGDRTSYPGDSTRKAKSLITSIKKVLSYLTKDEKQQAESEIDTIAAIFRNQL